MSTTAAVTTAAKGLKKYRRNWKLVRSKLLEYIPVMIITNLSVFLISSVDGVIAGNFVGKEAFSAINIFFPISVFTGAFSVIASYGISTSLSTAMGRNNTEEIAKIKNASIYIAIGMAIVAGIVQIPIAIMIINSYGLSPEMYDTTWKYAIACMLCTPFSMISCVGTLKLQIAGKMKALMVLTITEGLSNTAFDLLFVAVFQMGVAGTGFGTLCANLIRCTSTIIYLRKKTDFYKREKERPDPGLIKNILLCGIPDASVPVVSAFQNYFMLRILMNIFGMNGSVINGTTGFCFNFAYVLILGIQAGIRPLMGLFVGAKDFDAIRELIRQGAKYVFMILGTVTILFALFPGLVFRLHGIKDIPESGETCIRIFAIFFIIQGLNFLLRLYLSNRKDIRFTTAMTLGGNALQPLFEFFRFL